MPHAESDRPIRPAERLREARAHFRAGRRADALEAVQAALAADPGFLAAAALRDLIVAADDTPVPTPVAGAAQAAAPSTAIPDPPAAELMAPAGLRSIEHRAKRRRVARCLTSMRESIVAGELEAARARLDEARGLEAHDAAVALASAELKLHEGRSATPGRPAGGAGLAIGLWLAVVVLGGAWVATQRTGTHRLLGGALRTTRTQDLGRSASMRAAPGGPSPSRADDRLEGASPRPASPPVPSAVQSARSRTEGSAEPARANTGPGESDPAPAESAPDRTGLARTGPARTGPDRTGPGRTEPAETAPSRAARIEAREEPLPNSRPTARPAERQAAVPAPVRQADSVAATRPAPPQAPSLAPAGDTLRAAGAAPAAAASNPAAVARTTASINATPKTEPRTALPVPSRAPVASSPAVGAGAGSLGTMAAAAAPPPVPPPAAPSPRLREDDERLVRQVIERYQAAYGALDARSAQGIWPRVNAEALARAFAGLTAQELRFDDCGVDIRGTAALATCRGSVRYVPKIGRQEPRIDARVWTFSLEKQGPQWLIASARAAGR